MTEFKPIKTLMEQIEILKSTTSLNTYKYFEYDLKVERVDMEINQAGDTVIFVNVPGEVKIKLNEITNSEITVGNPIKIWHLFYRIFLTNEYHNTEEKLQFFIGFNLDIGFVNTKPDVRELLQKITTIEPASSWTSETKLVFNFNELIHTTMSDVDGNLKIEWSNDGINFDVQDNYPVNAGIGRGDVIEIKGKYVKFTFSKANPTDTQTIFRFLTFVR